VTPKATSWGDSLAAIGFWTIVVLTAFFLVSPILMVVPMSFSSGRYLEFPPPGWSLQWYRAFFASTDWMSSFYVSFQVALMATVVSLVLGVPAAFALARSNLPFKPFIFAFFSLPLVFPVVASAVALYYVFTIFHLVGTSLGLALAHSILALPVVILPTAVALQRFDHRLEWQALNLGASEWQTLRTVTLPLLRPILLTVTLFAFVTSFDEVIFAIFLSSGPTITLPKRIWEGLRFEIQPTVAVVATFLLIISSVVILAIAILQRRVQTNIQKRSHPAPWNSIN
jgi:putative spermidine/putrescine transport system permease protein